MGRVKVKHRKGIVAVSSAAILLGFGWRVHARVRQNDLDAALIQAVYADAPGKVTELLERGADCNAREVSSPRMNSLGDLVRYLLKRPKPPPSFTALLIAVSYSPSSAEILIRHHADVNAREGHGVTPLMMVPFRDKRDGRLTRLLLANGADLHATEERGRSALEYALIAKKTGIAKLLLARGADSSVHDEGRRVLLAAEAVDLDNPEVFTLLLTKWPELCAGDNKRHSPLGEVAARRGDARWLRILLSRGLDVNTRNEHGAPLLSCAVNSFCAVGRRNEGCIQLLLAKGADVNAQESHGITALDVAICDGDLPVAQHLRRLGATTHNYR